MLESDVSNGVILPVFSDELVIARMGVDLTWTVPLVILTVCGITLIIPLCGNIMNFFRIKMRKINMPTI